MRYERDAERPELVDDPPSPGETHLRREASTRLEHGHAAVFPRESIGEATTGTPPTENRDPLPEHAAALEDLSQVVDRRDIIRVATRYGRIRPAASGRQYDDVGAQLVHDSLVAARPKPDFDRELPNLSRQPTEHPPIGLVGLRCEREPPAQSIVAFAQHDDMTAQCSDPSGLETRRPTANDQYAPRAGRWNVNEFRLATRRWIRHASDRLAQENLADAVVVVHAGPSVLGFAVSQGIGKLRIGEELSAHGDEVGLAFLEGGLRYVRLDSPDGDHRNSYGPFDHCGEIEERARLMGGVTASVGEGASADAVRAGMDGVASGRLDRSGDLAGELRGDAVLLPELDRVDPTPDGELGPDASANRLDDLDEQVGADSASSPPYSSVRWFFAGDRKLEIT